MTTLIGGVTISRVIRPLVNVAERLADRIEMILRNNDKLSRDIRVAIPASVVSFNAENQTISAQPLIREKRIFRQTGKEKFIDIAVLVDIPVHFPQGGDFVATFPIQEGDEVLLVFQDMAIDSWWSQGGIQNWIDRRRHDLSDAIAIPGINSVPNVIDDIASDAAELRTKDGNFKVQVKTDEVRLVAPSAFVKVETAKIVLTAADIELNGNINGSGGYLSHKHTGVEPGVGESGPVDV